ncbi:MAG: 4-phosphoerythronate dehydrogenase PdxB [Tidjanibacter sp.]|nr:4-phosphoerythronate dehydrogenase PdxB [Tidjanibacter sp.]
MKIVCDNKIPFLKGALEPYGEVIYLPGAETTAEVVKDADVIVTRTRTKCKEALLSGSSVKMIVTATIGFDHIDTKWCEENGIEWTNCPGCNSGSVQQYIASVLVNLAKDYGFKTTDKTVGVIGVGNVGKKVARIAELLGFKVLLNDPPRARKEGADGFVDLDTVIKEADIITVHVPLQREGDDATFHLFDEARLAQLNKEQILINSSRGEVVDCDALKATLQKGGIKTAILDVWEKEPGIDAELLNLLYVGTPHIAGYSLDGKANGTTMSVQAIGRKFDLPCKEWQAENVPLPAQPVEFEIDAEGVDMQEVLSRAVLHTYDVKSDCKRLREDIGTFEKQRADYPVRREFATFSLHLKGADMETMERLAAMGFKLI